MLLRLAAAICLIGGAVVCDGIPMTDPAREKKHHLRVRREWSDLSKAERIEYTDAVKCLMKKPSVLPPLYNSTNMFDDFLAVHINHTWQIHLDGYFLGYHRGLVRVFEDALQTVCGYRGMQPYCHWPRYLHKPLHQSTLFDGSKSSFGSNGRHPTTDNDRIQGGGCVASGPFHKHKVPYVSLSLQDAETGKPPDRRAWIRNEDCLRRRLDDSIARSLANQKAIDKILASPNIDEFRRAMDPVALGGSGYGFHSGTHSMIGGHMRDLFTAPTDPIFYCLHAEIDYLYASWQAQDPADRIYGAGALSGSRTMLNSPNTGNAAMHDMLNFGNLTPLGRNRRLREMMNPSAKWLGYRYA